MLSLIRKVHAYTPWWLKHAISTKLEDGKYNLRAAIRMSASEANAAEAGVERAAAPYRQVGGGIYLLPPPNVGLFHYLSNIVF